MQMTSPDFSPRADGWFEHKGTWDEVTVGTVIADRERRSLRWEIIDVAHGQQVEYGHTLWMRAREQASGEEFTVHPRFKNTSVTILTQDPADTQTPEPTWPSDSEAIMRLVEELGATTIATHDQRTGEVTCPDYAAGYHATEDWKYGREEILHLRLAHGLEVPDDMPLPERMRLHGDAHHPSSPVGKGGFPHRHVPEDLSYL